MKKIFRVFLQSGEILEIYAGTEEKTFRLYAKGPFNIGPGQPAIREITTYNVTTEKIRWTVRYDNGDLQNREEYIKGF